MANPYQIHMDQDEDEDQDEEQVCNDSMQWNKDEDTRIKKRKSIELHEDEDRHAMQKVSLSSNTSIVDINATCGSKKTTSMELEHEVQEQTKLENLSKYDIFLNHRGPDVMKSFASHLDAALRRVDLQPFLDAESLVKRHPASNSINEALSGVYCHIAIFSPHYAESEYCLNELCDMLGSKKPIITVFYNVEPADLCWPEKGPFMEAFGQYIKRGQDEDVMRWKRALRKAANIPGFKLAECKNEAKLVEMVTNASIVDINVTSGYEKATSMELEHEVQEHFKLENLSKYDVFLNHRGPDVKKTFASHLVAALHQVGLQPFLDAKALVKGHHAFNSINEALSGVYCHVAIFSPRYAESKYCLNELCDMLASKKPIIPIFYHVKPTDLRWPKNGAFKEAFNYHIRRGRDEDVMRWNRALRKAADISGFELANCNNEAELVNKVTSAVLKAWSTPPPLASARHLVGLEETLPHVLGLLHEMGDNVGVLGIYGMGGIGKTTLVEQVYNHKQSSFPRKCFLQDIKDAKGIELMDLQMQLVNNLLGLDDVKKMVGDYTQCFEMIGKHKVLIIVDDISSTKQFHEIIPNINLLAPGSRVLVTSRTSDILNDIISDVPQHALCCMSELSFFNSRELFIWCAFQKVKLDDVEDTFHGIVNMITKACGGLPLALEVMGGLLADKKNDKEWIKATSTLENLPDVMTYLMISYEGLLSEDDRLSKLIELSISRTTIHELPKDFGRGILSARDLPTRRILGKGLVSIVYETELEGKRLARKEFRGVPSDIFEKEAIALVNLRDHENVVKTHNWTVDKMSCSLVLEYMDDNLLDLLQKRKESDWILAQPAFTLQESLGIMWQIARGMENLHDQDILHGDLKTNNILVNVRLNNGESGSECDSLVSVKVADFGLGRTKRKSIPLVSRQARKLDMVRWKAPECLKTLLSHLAEDNDETSDEDSDSDTKDQPTWGSSGVTDSLQFRADVYSFALTCFQILTGEDPYPGLNWKVDVVGIVMGDLRPTLPASCPELLKELLVSCWHKDPDQRPKSFSNIRTTLELLLNAPNLMVYTENSEGLQGSRLSLYQGTGASSFMPSTSGQASAEQSAILQQHRAAGRPSP